MAIIGFALAVAAAVWFGAATTEAPGPSQRNQQSTEEETPAEQEPAKPPQVDLQPTIDTWVTEQSGNYGIVVYDPANEAIIASHQPDEQFFTASIYKLYVAYLTLKDFQSGAQDPDEVILAGQTRKECVYKMIHSSDSPCGETILNDIGQATLGQRLKSELDFKATNFPGFTTSSGDVVRLLARLQAKDDLNGANTKFLLDAMRTQIYRTGLPQGMPDTKVANKVGFDSPDLWVDCGIITLPDGRDYVVSIFGNGGVGSSQIRSFGSTIYAKLAEN